MAQALESEGAVAFEQADQVFSGPSAVPSICMPRCSWRLPLLRRVQGSLFVPGTTIPNGNHFLYSQRCVQQ
jgi:hypothetical protein